ncbi:MAG TPA: cytochrome c oxidase subunit 3 [Steroidobacteraceae bacterium]|nr:cytochrome c oxidase subunit 3 [Steroidobacteraceae bacterium]
MPSARTLRPGMQYADLEQQSETAQLGMWLFLATEVLFFGSLIFAYTVYRSAYGHQFQLAGHDSFILLGSVNQAILVTSSLTMVLALRAARAGEQRALVWLLCATAALGLAFLGVKGYEYARDAASHALPAIDFVFKPGYRAPAEMFWTFYLISTGLHALHLSIGIVLVLIFAVRAARGAFSPAYDGPLEVVGLYWSFVDTVWFFLFACIYPLGRVMT